MNDKGTTVPGASVPSVEVLPETVLAVFNGIPGLVGYWDAEQRNLLANDAYQDFVGKSPAEIRGMHAREVMGEDLYARNRPRIELALAGEEQIFDRALTDATGRVRWTQTSYIPDVRDGRVRGFFVLVTDITDRVTAARTARRTIDLHRALARSLPSGFVLVFDEDLRYSLADGVELGAFDLSRRGLEGRTLHEAMPAPVVEEVEPHYRAALAGRSVSWETGVEQRTFKLTAGPVLDDDGTVIAGMVTAIDVTEDRTQQKAWRVLASISRDVARNASPVVVAQEVAGALVDVFDVTTASVVRFTGPDTGLVVALSPQRGTSLPVEVAFAPGDTTAASHVLNTGGVVTLRYDVPAQVPAGVQVRAGHRSAAGVPVRAGSELWGAVCVASDRVDGIDDRLLERLGTFGEVVELAVANSHSLDALEREAHTDALTGLPNRRAFDERLAREVELTQLEGHALSVAIMDVDHFKAVNDRHGHPVGDSVLAEIAERVRAVSRERDLVARIGGEEFGWIMPGASGQQAVDAAERLRAAVSGTTFTAVGSLTISLGVCGIDDARDPQELVLRADEALYAAKRGGRNRVERSLPDLAAAR